MADAGRRTAFVTGGGGYVGNKLCKDLVERGYTVTAYDLAYLDQEGDVPVNKIQGDIRDKEKVALAMKESHADVVFHIASYGMSGREMLNRELIEAVNITGTENIIEACVEHGVTRLVYTSTYNVVFGGQEIHDGDDSLPPLPSNKHVDHYSRTKATAEKAVLNANGRTVGNGGLTLKTCALRCAGIYGEGEQRHLPRIVAYIERGLFKFTYGAKDSLVEFLHGDNFCQAHIKAAEKMAQTDSPVPGQVYFISDGKPINNFEFFKPLVEGLGYAYPTVRLPLALIYFIEVIHSIVGTYIYNFQPLLTRAEVYKTGVTHYFSMDKARQHFDYQPESRNLDGVIKWFRERGHGRSSEKRQKSRMWSLFVNVLVCAVVLVLVMSFLPVVK